MVRTPFSAERLADAVLFAGTVHARQRRRNGTPYLSHPLATAALVIEYGGDGDQAVAGVLHDTREDGPPEVAEELRTRFGPRVAELVAWCTDPPDTDPAAWRQLDRAEKARVWRARKAHCLERLLAAPDDALLVAGCDKLHNARSLGDEIARSGAKALDGFAGGREGLVWYYESLAGLFESRGVTLAAALRAAVTHWVSLAAEPERARRLTP